MRKTAVFCFCAFMIFFIAYPLSAGRVLIVPGTGDSQNLLREVAKAMEKELDGDRIEIPETIGSGGGIKAVIAGKAEIARVARPLKEKEVQYGLSCKLFARSPIVFVVNPSVKGIDNIRIHDLINIYSGATGDWSGLSDTRGKIYPVTRQPGDSCLTVIDKNIPGFSDSINPKIKIIYSTPDNLDTLKEHRNTIGFLPLAMAENSGLKILKIEGVYPSPENVKSGKYRLTVPLGIVYKAELQGMAKRFVDFLYSDKGREIILKNGAIPVNEEKSIKKDN